AVWAPRITARPSAAPRIMLFIVAPSHARWLGFGCRLTSGTSASRGANRLPLEAEDPDHPAQPPVSPSHSTLQLSPWQAEKAFPAASAAVGCRASCKVTGGVQAC